MSSFDIPYSGRPSFDPAADSAARLAHRPVGRMGDGLILQPVDSADRLPKEAREKLENLREQAADARGALEIAMTKREAAREAFDEATIRLRAMADPESPHSLVGSRLGADHPSWVAGQDAQRRAKSRLDRETALERSKAEVWRHAATFVEGIERWLEKAPQEAVKPFSGGLPELDGAPADVVAKCRRRLDNLQAEQAAVQGAPFPKAELKERARAQITKLSDIGRPNLGGLIAHGGHIQFASQKGGISVSPRAAGDAGGSAAIEGAIAAAYHNSQQADAFAFLCWLNEPQIIARLEAEIESRASDKSAIASEQRAPRIASIKAEMLKTERIEEAAIVAAGGAMPRRPDADPRAVLGLADGDD